MHLLTCQLSRWWTCRQYGVELIDVSNGNGLSIFIPSSDSYWGWKRGQIDDSQFANEYSLKMRHSWNSNRSDWMEFMQLDHPIALATYEGPDVFSHRLVLKDILEMLCKNLQIPFFYYGDLK